MMEKLNAMLEQTFRELSEGARMKKASAFLKWHAKQGTAHIAAVGAVAGGVALAGKLVKNHKRNKAWKAQEEKWLNDKIMDKSLTPEEKMATLALGIYYYEDWGNILHVVKDLVDSNWMKEAIKPAPSINPFKKNGLKDEKEYKELLEKITTRFNAQLKILRGGLSAINQKKTAGLSEMEDLVKAADNLRNIHKKDMTNLPYRTQLNRWFESDMKMLRMWVEDMKEIMPRLFCK